jgi:Flp pilus assembly protein TadB
LALVVLALWVVTASAGVALLSSGNAARRRAAPSAQMASAPARYGAVPLTADGKPPPVPRTRVAAPAGEHPLLEFSHPALALAGLAFWFVFVLIHYRPLAWISLGILVVTLGAGLRWLAANARAARRQQKAARPFPPRLIALHGLAAAVAFTLTVLTALTASHG